MKCAVGNIHHASERTTILQALGGDLTIEAERDKVMLIREVDGVQQHININMKSHRS